MTEQELLDICIKWRGLTIKEYTKEYFALTPEQRQELADYVDENRDNKPWEK